MIYDTIRYDTIYDMIYDTIRYDMIYDTIRYMIRYNMIWYYMIRYDIIYMLYNMIYDIYLLTAIELTSGGSSTVHIYTQTIHRTTQLTQTMHRTAQWKQNIQIRTYITIRIHKHNNKNTQFTKIKTKAHKTYNHIYNDKKWNQKNMKECDKRKKI